RLQSRGSRARYGDLRGDALAAGRLPGSGLPDDIRQGPLGGDAGLSARVSAGPDERHQLRGPAPAWKSGETISRTPLARIMEPWRRQPTDRATSFRWRR